MKETSLLSIKKALFTREHILAFTFSFVIGLVVHIYKFTNYLPNHDGMYNIFSDQNMTVSGRWLLSLVCGFSSYYDLPWINGLFSLIFISLTCLIIISIFHVKKPIVILLISGLIVTFPSITETFCFEFTADGYMLAMFLAALAAYVHVRRWHSFIQIGLSSVFICALCGIYQAYVSFFILLFVCWYLWIIFTEDFSNKCYLKYIRNFVISLAVGLFLYYIIWKVCLFFQGVSPTDNQGIDKMQLLFITNPSLVLNNIISSLVTFILEKNIFKHGISLYALLNIVFLLFSFVILIVAIIKSKTCISWFKLISVIGSVLLLPFAICLWQLISPGVAYGYRMLQSIFIIYAFSVILCDRFFNHLIFNTFCMICFCIIVNFSVLANVAYYYLNFEYECSFAEANRLVYAIEDFKREHRDIGKVAILGNREKEVALDQQTEANGAFLFTNMIEKSLLFDSMHTENFLKNVLYYDANFADYNEKVTIENTKEFSQMESWFKGGSIEIINNTITIKL